MDLDQTHPSLADLRAKAKTRIPHFVWEFLDSATGNETTARRNREALDRLLFRPGILHGDFQPDPSTRFLGRDYPLPFGVAPVGMSGLVWPDAERRLARRMVQHGLPYTLSTVAARTPEELAPQIGDQGWFQLYPPRDPEIRRDLVKRARDAGFHTLAITLDIPAASRRERQIRGGMSVPPRMSARIMAQSAVRPFWAMGVMRHGKPRLKTLEAYEQSGRAFASNAHIGYQLRVAPDWDYLAQLRDEWQGPLIAKGVLNGKDALRLRNEGIDAVWVSNHAGRQFDAAPSAIDALREIRAAVGPDYPLIYDSAVMSGLDILRAVATGADFVMLGKAFHWGLAAFGGRGIDHVVHILQADMISCMAQIGARKLRDLAGALYGN